MKSNNWLESFRHALRGIRSTARRERNFRIHIFFAILVVAACIIFRVEAIHFIMVGFAIFFVMAMELVNTAVEALVDMYCRGKPHPMAKLAKDAAAGAVLLASVQAVVVGIVVAISIIRRYI
ncbi:MAG: diacylglycerol kinase family protein [Defluviitaleaceae bacterium]|nr:diacylglycerol kinase family protein [Defluviitaleaceae bacterium]